MRLQSKRVAAGTLFGVVIFISKTAVPTPVDKMFIVFQALLLALGALLLGRWGATYVAAVGGALTALWRIAFAPFSLGTAILYGFLVDGLFYALRVKSDSGDVRPSRLLASMTISTALVGLTSYYMTVFWLGLLQRNPVLEVTILVAGTLSGAFGGYFASIIWGRYLKNAEL